MALHLLARRGVPTLILVHNRNLLVQWKDRLQTHLGLSPKDIGGVKGNQLRPGQRVTLATFQSLLRRNLEPLIEQTTQVLVDECHHTPARSFAAVLRQLRPRYLVGLTATDQRKDQLERLIFLFLGNRVQAPSTQQLDRSGDIILPQLRVHTTAASEPAESPTHHARLQNLTENPERNLQIARDARQAVAQGHLVLILSDRTQHCDPLEELLKGKVPYAILHGAVAGKREKFVLEEFRSGRVRVLLATPISGKGSDLVQLIGRLTRPHPDKPAPQFIDYLDEQIPVFRRMFEGRLKTYRRILLPELLPGPYRPTRPARRGKAEVDYGPPPEQLHLFDSP